MRGVLIACALLLVPLLAGVRAEPTTRPNSMTIVSFNIRNGGAPDGENAWPRRAEFFFQTVRKLDPDLLGMQEVLLDQLDAAKAALPGHSGVGVARDDGKTRGEFAPIFFRNDRFTLIETGTWWLSPTPDVVGSVGWDAALTRIATWARLRDNASDEALLVVNTHFDHVGQIARAESAKLLREKMKDETGRVILMGDFNCTEADAPYRAIVEGGVFVDAFRAKHPTPTEDEASFHGFSGETKGRRIDFIFTKGFETIDANIDRTRDGKRCPSDHDAVTATVK